MKDDLFTMTPDGIRRLIRTEVDAALRRHCIDRHKASKSRFEPPTRDDVLGYCTEKGLNLDIDKFMDHYESKGWKIGRVLMKDWRAAARNAARDWAIDLKKPNCTQLPLCECGCGRQAPMRGNIGRFYSRACRKKVLGW